MTVHSGHFTLTAEQRRFKAMLDAYPRIAAYWDFDKRECDVDGLQRELGAMSHGEAVMARFLAGVWLGENTLAFDLIEAVKVLDSDSCQCVIDWLSHPEFP